MNKDEALKMAIEELHNALKLLKRFTPQSTGDGSWTAWTVGLKDQLSDLQHTLYNNGFVEGIDACKEALQQPAQESVVLLEALSDLEHQQWMKWAKSIIDSEPISEARKQRWLTMMVDYKDLPDNIQEYDREWARKVMALYTRPAQPLSDDEIERLADAITIKWHIYDFDMLKFARVIEQAHGIGEKDGN